MFVGMFILLIGIFMLLERMEVIEGGFGDYILPILLLAFGLSMIFNHFKGKKG